MTVKKKVDKMLSHFVTPPFHFDKMVGMTGFEPAASSSRTRRATKLCHIPTTKIIILQSSFPRNPFFYFSLSFLGKEQENNRNNQQGEYR